jgi:putative mRNA 3-end processing factor
LQIGFLGGAREVGRIGISVKSKETQYLLDYGVMLGRQPGFPMHVPPKDVDALILTHSHLDHSGALPIFYIDGKRPLYTNRLNLGLTQLLIQDFIHLSGYFLPFEYLELQAMMQSSKHLDYKVTEKVGTLRVALQLLWKPKAKGCCLLATLILKIQSFSKAPAWTLEILM